MKEQMMKTIRGVLAFGLLIGAIVVGSVMLTHQYSTRAQDGYTAQDAINLVTGHPAFAGLASQEGWSAAAYDTENAYGIWRVQFWDADGEDLGWADVSIERSKVYSWESYIGLPEDQYGPAETTIRAALLNDADVMELIDARLAEATDITFDELDVYVDFQAWSQRWSAYVDMWPNSLYITLISQTDNPRSLDSLRVDQIYFDGVVSYQEWYDAEKAQATTIAFGQAEIAAALRGVNGWTAEGDLGDDGIWYLNFMLGDQWLASASVVVETAQVLEFSVP